MATPTRYKLMNEQVDVTTKSPTTPNPVYVTGQGPAQEVATVSRYTPPTPPTTPTATPAPSPVITPTPTVTAPTAAKPTLQTVDENTIREETRKRMQASVDAINAQFASMISQENTAGEDRSGQTRAVNARSGTIGSDFGAAQQEKTTQFNKSQLQALEAQKAAQVQAILTNIEDRASAEIERRKQEALGTYNREMGDWQAEQEKARGDLQVLAKSGVALETLNPAQKAALLKQAGYEDTALGELVYNAMKPKAQQIDYKFEKLADGQGLFYGVDPVTGQLVTKNVKVDLPPDWQMQIAPDGTLIGYDKNTGQARIMSGRGDFADPLKQAQIDKIYADIAEGNGDGLLSIEEANKLGVPYGTTKSQAVGIVPGGTEKVQQAERSASDIQAALDLINVLKEHKGLDGATGFLGSRVNVFGESRDFAAKFDQLQAMLQLGNIDKLRGTGPITESEQAVLRNAASSLRRDGDKTKLTEEMRRLEEVLKGRLEKQQNIINVGSQSTIQEFESQYGGSEGTNPKAPSGQSSSLSVNTKQIASTVLPKFPTGSTGGQCVTFLHKIADFPSIGDGKNQKFASVDKLASQGSAIKGNLTGQAKVGMILVTGENQTYGHGAMINAISADGKYARLTESNFKGSEKVSHDRIIALDNPKIYGAIIPKSIKNIG